MLLNRKWEDIMSKEHKFELKTRFGTPSIFGKYRENYRIY